MAADAIAHLHPDDLTKVTSGVLEGIRGEIRALLEASAQPPAPMPPLGRPPADLDSLDARQFERFKNDILNSVSHAVRRETSDFLPEDEIEGRIANVTTAIDQRIEALKTTFLVDVRKIVTEENEKLRQEFFEIFEDLDLPLDKGEKRRATREKVAGLVAMHASSQEFKSEFWKHLRTAVIGWIVAAVMGLLAFAGLKGGGSH